MLRTVLFASMALASVHPHALQAALFQQAPLRVVTTLPVYASIVREIGGSEVEVSAIADPNEDAHFVRPKPSFALDLRRADAFVTTGLDLELWVPTLLDRAGNANVLEGGRGYITAATGITLLDIPVAADRSGGDVHIFGNPHVTSDPLRTLQVARNITAGLKRVAPARAARFDRGLASFAERIHRRLFGERLVELLSGPTLEQLATNGTLFNFLETNEFGGVRLIDELGGWLGEGQVFRGREIICYHKNWAYFEDRFGVRCADYVEAKPGIQPTPGHVSELIERMRSDDIGVLLAASYFQRTRVEAISNRGGATLVQVPLSPGVMAGGEDYFGLVELWVGGLARAFSSR
ncbi:MAG: metal ABC transporter substrate-binding protein [Gemmatimonadota bacterium]|nr:metal ABC transporter substrate-binding protein [Gemmatimonadota bacterium]MDH3422593.1 metal ABC transporter substrate-binding protein [Gemmatimonadota bacterium]